MYKKIIAATLCSSLVLFLGGGLLFGVLFKEQMVTYMSAIGSCANPSPDMLHIVLANLVLSLLLALLLHRLHISTFKSGAIAATWICLLIALWFDAWMFATFHFMTLSMFVLDVLSNTLLGTLGGGVIGFIFDKMKAES